MQFCGQGCYDEARQQLPFLQRTAKHSKWCIWYSACHAGRLESSLWVWLVGWGGTLGVNWQQAKCVDEHGRTLRQDVYGSPLTFSGGASDTMAMALLRAVYTCLPPARPTTLAGDGVVPACMRRDVLHARLHLFPLLSWRGGFSWTSGRWQCAGTAAHRLLGCSAAEGGAPRGPTHRRWSAWSRRSR